MQTLSTFTTWQTVTFPEQELYRSGNHALLATSCLIAITHFFIVSSRKEYINKNRCQKQKLQSTTTDH
jgi:hypothetical protein